MRRASPTAHVDLTASSRACHATSMDASVMSALVQHHQHHPHRHHHAASTTLPRFATATGSVGQVHSASTPHLPSTSLRSLSTRDLSWHQHPILGQGPAISIAATDAAVTPAPSEAAEAQPQSQPEPRAVVGTKPDLPSKLAPVEARLFKTRMCRHFTELGKCQHGDECAFAHGKWELRTRRENAAALAERKKKNKAVTAKPHQRPSHPVRDADAGAHERVVDAAAFGEELSSLHDSAAVDFSSDELDCRAPPPSQGQPPQPQPTAAAAARRSITSTISSAGGGAATAAGRVAGFPRPSRPWSHDPYRAVPLPPRE